uniref:TPM2 n=1 Tax=Caenorhabditis tropicalis TaxID=1561998 RepID=A0A1I7UHA5_9PELO
MEKIRKEIKTSRKEDQDYCKLKKELAERDEQLKESRETVARYEKESREWKVKEQELYRRMRENQIDWINWSEKTEKRKHMEMKHGEQMRMELIEKAEDSLEKLADSEEEVKRLNGIVEALNKRFEEMCESSEKITLEMAERQKETENELERVKSQLKEAKEELERIQEDDSEEDSSFDQLDDE